MVLAAFLTALAAFVLVGLASASASQATKADYYAASRSLSPPLVGLSAIATNNSGYMFIGLMGFTWSVGLSSLWLMVGWILGDFLASGVVHRALRRESARRDELTLAGALAAWHGTVQPWVRRAAALVTLALLGAYAAAQLTAGGKALQSMFDWPAGAGALLVAAIVAAYCMAGGLRASVWTDVAQSAVMIVAMGLLLVFALEAAGGAMAAWGALAEVPGYLDPFPADLLLPGWAGAGLFVLGWMFAGASVIGQPHIMIRFMALDRDRHFNAARAWYYGFFVLFYAMAAAVGLLSRLLLPELGAEDPELALPSMAAELLPPVLVGVVLAGIFAATMSTADSLVLSCSSAITHDLLGGRLEQPLQVRLVTLLVVGLALAIALAGTQSVFVLVIFAWSGLASAFGPLLWSYARGVRLAEGQALAVMFTGLAVALGWRGLGWQDSVYEGLPGMLAGWVLIQLLTRR